MTKLSDPIWLSVHLFYNEPWEEFLREALEPYVNTAIQTGIVHQYFFIRYWERGPHIRLRLKGEREMVKAVLEPNIKEHFESYFESRPSLRTEPSYPNFFPDETKWLPNNTLHTIPYVQETDRYGGLVGVEIAEQQFMLSSKIILSFITEKAKNWSYDDGMGTAIKLYLPLVVAAKFSLEEAVAFFEMLCQTWLPYSLGVYQSQLEDEALEQQIQLTIDAFESAFETQKESLVAFHQNLWDDLEKEDSFENSIMDEWMDGNKAILQKLKEEILAGNIAQRPESFSYKINSNVSIQSELEWQMIADYIHLSNNRLGIQNKDESYLAFMMMKSLQEVLKKKESRIV